MSASEYFIEELTKYIRGEKITRPHPHKGVEVAIQHTWVTNVRTGFVLTPEYIYYINTNTNFSTRAERNGKETYIHRLFADASFTTRGKSADEY